MSDDWSSDKKGILSSHEYHRINGKNDECKSAKDAIIVMGENFKTIGRIIRICADKDCKKHLGVGGSSYHKTPAEIKRERDVRKRERNKKERENKEILRVLPKIKWPLSEKHLDVLIEAMVLRNGFTIVRPIVLRHGWEVLRSHPPYEKKGVMRPDYELTLKEKIKTMSSTEKVRIVMEFCIEDLYFERRNKIIKSL